jgi:hypothetical protein
MEDSCRCYVIYERLRNAERPVGRVEAYSCTEALGKFVPDKCSLHGLHVNKKTGVCTAIIREKGAVEKRTFVAYPAELVDKWLKQ